MITGVSAPEHSTPCDLIVGIGNPGQDYADTRHNAGVWFVDALIARFGGNYKSEKKFHGRLANVVVESREVRVLVPDTYMNDSGKSVSALSNFFKIAPEAILVAHDEIDFPPGKMRFKQSGGFAGHNGLRDISRMMSGSAMFNRLRIGVGHPGHQTGVTGHVLGKVPKKDRDMIDACIQDAITAVPLAVKGDWQGAMQYLHNLEQPYQGGDD